MKNREQIRGGYVEAFNQCSSKNKTKSDPIKRERNSNLTKSDVKI